MILEVGDYFVVTRGIKLNMSMFYPVLGSSNCDAAYDRSYNGFVFKAEEVCGKVVAARLIGIPGNRTGSFLEIGSISAFNLDEVDVMPVSQKFAKLFDVSFLV